jgi:mannose-6-phosphate isomerase-like protein (cupin superfamily)
MNIEEYIRSGILEMFVLGKTSEEENQEIAEYAAIYPEIKNEIDEITQSFIAYSESKVKEINPSIKPMVMAIIDYTERMKSGETPVSLNILNENSKISDFAEWQSRPDMVLPEYFTDMYARIIGYDATAITAIVWIKDATPYEIHTDEHEKFLILEGTCDIITDSKTYSLVSGDYFGIPLHEGHVVKVTSLIPCKVILQRVAA